MHHPHPSLPSLARYIAPAANIPAAISLSVISVIVSKLLFSLLDVV